jgi:hypothetical protein
VVLFCGCVVAFFGLFWVRINPEFFTRGASKGIKKEDVVALSFGNSVVPTVCDLSA